MLNLQSGDRVEFSYKDGPTTAICATVGRLLSDQDEGTGVEIEDYIARWIEITLDEPSDMDWNRSSVSAKRPSGNSSSKGCLRRLP